MAVALAVGTVSLRGGSGRGGGEAPAAGAEPAPVAVEAVSARAITDLDELAAASDVVVRARVVATARGRVFGEGDAALVSRLVTVEVEGVLGGPRGAGLPPSLLVEEEGWLADGREVAVDGLAPSRQGLDAVWFLEDVGDPDLPVWVLVDTRGRYAVDGEALVGPARPVTDPLVAEVESLGLGGLGRRLRGG